MAAVLPEKAEKKRAQWLAVLAAEECCTVEDLVVLASGPEWQQLQLPAAVKAKLRSAAGVGAGGAAAQPPPVPEPATAPASAPTAHLAAAVPAAVAAAGTVLNEPFPEPSHAWHPAASQPQPEAMPPSPGVLAAPSPARQAYLPTFAWGPVQTGQHCDLPSGGGKVEVASVAGVVVHFPFKRQAGGSFQAEAPFALLQLHGNVLLRCSTACRRRH